MKLTGINAILASENRSSPYGAPMGAASTFNPDAPAVRLQRLTMIDGDYSADGTYWGAGNECIGHMFCAWNQKGTRIFVRGLDESAARAHVLRDYPAAVFLDAFDHETMTRAFIECMCWAESGDPESPLGENASPDRLTRKARKVCEELCADFIGYCTGAGIDYSKIDPSQMGHDLWLTMQGHGAGFWDRGLGRLGDQLTKAAKTFSAECWRGRGGWIHVY